jgi:STE24 endopeptidase
MKKETMHPLIDKEKQVIAKRYQKENRIIGLASFVISGIIVFILLYFDLSRSIVAWLEGITPIRFFLVLLYFALIYSCYSIITLPLSYIGGFVIEHRYGFSKQTTAGWFLDWVKSFGVSFILGGIIFQFIYGITYASPHLWWLWLSLAMIIFNVILANLFPVLIVPLFYKTTPVEDQNLLERIRALCEKARIQVRGIYSIDLSSKSTKANAAVVGLGNTKRILLGDTFVADYTENEIVSVLAHEVTHYQEHHIWWLVLWQSIITVIMFYVFHLMYPALYEFAGFTHLHDVAAFPLFVLIFTVISLVLNPVGAGISRYFERRADRGALELTGDPETFISVMANFCNRQLSVAYPHPLIEWYKYSHPSPGKRIGFAERWRDARQDE